MIAEFLASDLGIEAGRVYFRNSYIGTVRTIVNGRATVDVVEAAQEDVVHLFRTGAGVLRISPVPVLNCQCRLCRGMVGGYAEGGVLARNMPVETWVPEGWKPNEWEA